MFDIVLVILVTMFLGYAAARTGILKSEHNRQFSRFVFYVSIPCLLLALFGTSKVLEKITPQLLLLTALPMFACVMLAYLLKSLLKLDTRLTAMLMLAAIMPSSTFVGFPATQLLFGDEGMAYASIIGPLHLVITMLIAVPLLEYMLGKKGKTLLQNARKILLHPIILAILFGILLNVTSTTLPNFVQIPLESVGASTIPVSLFAIGLFVSGVRFQMEKFNTALLLSLARLLPLPLLIFLLAPYLDVSELPLAVSLLLALTPVAVLDFLLAQEYDLDAEAMSLAIVMTTVLLPLPIYLVSAP